VVVNVFLFFTPSPGFFCNIGYQPCWREPNPDPQFY